MAVRWLYDFRSEQGPEGAVLYDRLGFRFAVEGEQLNLSGTLDPDGVLSMCLLAGIAMEGPSS